MTVFPAVFSHIPTLLQGLSTHLVIAIDAMPVSLHSTGMILSVPEKHPDWIGRIAFISTFTCIIPLVIGALRYRYLDRGSRLLTLYLLIALCTEILGYVLALTMKMNTQIIYNIYTPIEFALFIFMFRFWHDGKTVRKLLTMSIPAFLLLWAGGQMLLAYKGISMKAQVDFADVLLPVESLILIVVAIITLVEFIRDETTPVISSGAFWITAAVLFYFTGNLFVFTFQSIILEDSFMKQAWYLHSTMNFVKYGLFTVGLYFASKNMKRDLSTHTA